MPDPYITKAEEICPKKKDCFLLREKCQTENDFKVARDLAFNQALSLCLPIVADLLKRVDELEEAIDNKNCDIKSLCDDLDRYKKALAEIENNHFECDAGEACKAHNIAKEALEGK